MTRYVKTLVLVAFATTMTTCRSLPESGNKPYKVKKYIDEGRDTERQAVSRTLNIVVSISIEDKAKLDKAQLNDMKWRLTSWKLSNGLCGTLRNNNGKPISDACELREGENRLQLTLNSITASQVKPTLTLTVVGMSVHSDELEIDLAKAVTAMAGGAIAEIRKSLPALQQTATQAMSQQAIDDVRYEQNRLKRKLKELRSTIELCEDSGESVEGLRHQLDMADRDIETMVGKSADDAQRALDIQAKFGRKVNEFHRVTSLIPLQEAIKNGDEAGVSMLLLHPETDVEKRNEKWKDQEKFNHQESPLSLAFLSQKLNMMKLLLKAGADPNQHYGTYCQIESRIEFDDDEHMGLWFHMINGGNLVDFPASQRQEVYNLLKKYGWNGGGDEYDRDKLKRYGVNP